MKSYLNIDIHCNPSSYLPYDLMHGLLAQVVLQHGVGLTRKVAVQALYVDGYVYVNIHIYTYLFMYVQRYKYICMHIQE